MIGVGDGGPERVQVTPVNGGGQPVRLIVEDGVELRAYLENVSEGQVRGTQKFDRQRERMNR